MSEIWKDISGYDGWYQVSNKGRVRSWKKKPVGRREKPYVFQVYVTPYGYNRIGLRKRNKKKLYKVHRLVAEAFIPNPENKPQVNHIDGDKLNNHVENLEWATSQENIQHAFDTGLRNQSGEDNGNHKLTDGEVVKIIEMYDGEENLLKDVAKEFDISVGYTWKIINGWNRTTAQQTKAEFKQMGQ